MHCVARAVIHDQGGIEKATAKCGSRAERLSKWQATKAAVKVTPKASRVSAFVVMWAVAMWDEGVNEFSITEYQRYWNEGERQTYRLQGEFRELWPEFETPNELARQVAKQINRNMSRRDAALLPSRVSVVAEAH